MCSNLPGFLSNNPPFLHLSLSLFHLFSPPHFLAFLPLSSPGNASPASDTQARWTFQSRTPSRPSHASTTRAVTTVSSRLRRAPRCCSTSVHLTTGGRGDTTASTASCPTSTSFSRTCNDLVICLTVGVLQNKYWMYRLELYTEEMYCFYYTFWNDPACVTLPARMVVTQVEAVQKLT